jgi:hypothetical protein
MKWREVTGTAACWLIAGAAIAQASETGPVIVVPGRAGVPIIVNGQDISGAIISGDWGLDRPSQTDPRILYRYHGGSLIGPAPAAYYPKTGRAPKVGRREVDTPHGIDRPESFYRSFGVQSDPTPVTPPGTQQQMPIIVAPQINPGHHP